MCCEYYLTHTPDPRFSKYDIKAYYEASKKTEIAEVNSSLGELTIFGAVFPKKAYRENIFTCYPILLRDFDVTNDTTIQTFLAHSVAFTEASYDYMVMLITDDDGKIQPHATKFPQRAFRCLRAEQNGEDIKYFEDFTSPFPVEVTSDMLGCFEEEYNLQPLGSNRQWLGKIGEIGEELWVYSKNRELLVDETDCQYLWDSLADVKLRIEGILDTVSRSIDGESVSLIRSLCDEVYGGEKFDNKEYNDLIACIQMMA